MSKTRDRSGFSLVEVTVVLVILLGLAAVLTPGLLGRLDHSRVEASERSLIGLGTAIHDPSRGGGSFRQHVGVFPGAVSHLTRQIGTADLNSCGAAYTTTDSAGWRGPYLNRTVPATGIPVGVGVLRVALTREPATGGTAPVLKLHVDSVDLGDAASLDLLVDGVRDSAAGTVRWGPANADGFVTVDYLIPVKNC